MQQDISAFWKQEEEEETTANLYFKNNKRIISIILIILFFGIGIGLNLPHNKEDLDKLSQLTNVLGEEAKLPEIGIVNLKEQAIKDNDLKEVGNNEALKVLSANLIGIYEQSQQQKQSLEKSNPISIVYAQAENNKATDSSELDNLNLEAQKATASSSREPKLAGIRILGEVQNIGHKTVKEAKTFIRFYKKKKLIATKLANFTQGYKFLPLASKEVTVYDVLVPNPPTSDSITIEMRADENAKKDSQNKTEYTQNLKIKEKKLEPEEASGGGQTIKYYKFTGKLVNIGDSEIVSPGLYAWLKNIDGKVIGFASKTFDADLLLPENELESTLLIIPVSGGEIADYKVKTFGSKL